MTAGETGACPVPGCDGAADDGGLTCLDHWRLVPRFTQRAWASAQRVGWHPVGGKARPWSWWSERALAEIAAALANRDRQLVEVAERRAARARRAS